MTRTGAEGGNGGGWWRYGLPGLVVGLVLAFGLEARGPAAQAQVPGGGTSPAGPLDRSRPAMATAESAATGTIAMVVPTSGTAQFLYMIDTRTRALAIYRVDPSAQDKGAIKLVAARQYQWDLKLTEYNCLPPEVSAIESTVRSLERQATR